MRGPTREGTGGSEAGEQGGEETEEGVIIDSTLTGVDMRGRCIRCWCRVETTNGCDCLRRHVDDALIAQQLPPTTDAQFLAKCRAVEIARRLMADELRAAEAV